MMSLIHRIAQWFDSLFSDALAENAKPEPLFDRRYVYPSDEVGVYTELTGIVVAVDEQDYPDDEVQVVVKTDRGEFSGYTSRPPKVGYTATIRLYDSGGGWYPDDRIVSWSQTNAE